MREQVAQAVTLGVVSPPSEEQWAMILCRQPLARIFAGAGSGKSTTLVLRVVFMLCHLGVEPQRLTVISFTNASCTQLREQLLRLLAHWQYPFDAAQARQCVRTFHSALGSLAREVLGNPRWFEQLDDRDPAAEPDNPCRRTPASGQQRLLKQAYQQCYAESPAFRAKIHKLLELPPPAEPEEARGGSRSAAGAVRWPASSRRCRCTKPSMPRPGSPRAWACASNAWTAASWNAGCARRSSSKPWHCSGRGSRRCCARRA